MEKKPTIDKKLIMQKNPKIDEKTAENIENFVKWQKAADEALQATGNKYGEVEFDCPLCGGKAHYSREYTPNFVHSVTVRGGCDKCGLHLLN